MSVPKFKRHESDYAYIENMSKIRTLIVTALKKMGDPEDSIEAYFRKRMLDYITNLALYIRIAHDIYMKTDVDYKMRRSYQNRALSVIYHMMNEIDYYIYSYPKHTDRFIDILEILNNEVIVLKGWRKKTDDVGKSLANKP